MTKKFDILLQADISEFQIMAESRGNGTGPELTEAELEQAREYLRSDKGQWEMTPATRELQHENAQLRSVNEALKATVRELQQTIRVICREGR